MVANNGWSPAPVWGCVLIGGRSSRMGTPKHLLSSGGVTWVERTVAVMARQVDQVVISGQGELPASLAQLPRITDAVGVAGPLGGILAMFRWRPATSWLVVACDLPDLEEAALQWLLTQQGPEVCAVLPDLEGDGRVEPLLAFYDCRCAPCCEEMAAAGHRRINRLREYPGVITPQPPQPLRRAWRNVNRPEDLRP